MNNINIPNIKIRLKNEGEEAVVFQLPNIASVAFYTEMVREGWNQEDIARTVAGADWDFDVDTRLVDAWEGFQRGWEGCYKAMNTIFSESLKALCVDAWYCEDYDEGQALSDAMALVNTNAKG